MTPLWLWEVKIIIFVYIVVLKQVLVSLGKQDFGHAFTYVCVCDVASERSLTKWCVVNTLDLEFLLFKRLEYCARKTPLMCHNSMCVYVYSHVPSEMQPF